jgi:hypothetical protein
MLLHRSEGRVLIPCLPPARRVCQQCYSTLQHRRADDCSMPLDGRKLALQHMPLVMLEHTHKYHTTTCCTAEAERMLYCTNLNAEYKLQRSSIHSAPLAEHVLHLCWVCCTSGEHTRALGLNVCARLIHMHRSRKYVARRMDRRLKNIHCTRTKYVAPLISMYSPKYSCCLSEEYVLHPY